jgi:putative peptidoglycan lipid II flippase
MMAHGIVAVSVITALMPRMAAAAAEHRHGDLVDQLSLGTRLTAVVLVPATVAYIVLGRPLAVSLFEWGQYSHSAAIATGTVIALAGLGLVPFAISQLQLFAFYAMPDTRTPALINVPVWRIADRTRSALLCRAAGDSVAAGLMAGNAISFVVAALIGYGLLRRRLGRLGLTRVFATLGRLGWPASSRPAVTTVVLVVMTLVWGDEKAASAIQLAVGAVVLFATYVARRCGCASRRSRSWGRWSAPDCAGKEQVNDPFGRIQIVTGWALDVTVIAGHP